MAQDKAKTREDAHKSLDIVLDTIAKIPTLSRAVIEFNCVQGSIRDSKIDFRLSNFNGLSEVKEENRL
jgi:hypothetical protein